MAGHARIENVVFDDYAKRIGCIGVAIYGLLLRFANDAGECWPSLKTIEDTLDISRPTALKYLGLLAEEQLIAIQKRRDEHGNQDTTLYRVFVPETASKSRVKKIDSGSTQSKAVSGSRVNDVRVQSKNGAGSRVNELYTNNPQVQQDPLNNDLPPPQFTGLPGDGFVIAERFFGQNLALLESVLGFIGQPARKELVGAFESYIRRGKPPTLEHLDFAIKDARAYSQAETATLSQLLTGLSKAIDPRPEKPNGPQQHPANRPGRSAPSYGRANRRELPVLTDEQRAERDRAEDDFWASKGLH